MRTTPTTAPRASCRPRRRALRCSDLTGSASCRGFGRSRPRRRRSTRSWSSSDDSRSSRLVRLLEETPRDRLLEEVAGRMRKGLSYRELLDGAAAGRRAQRPAAADVGFKFHAVLVVNSAHLASLASPDTDRWLPIFWALDHFKSSQAQRRKEGDWTMAPVDEVGRPVRRQGPATRSPRRWTTGTRRPPTRPSRRWPARARRNEVVRAVRPLRRARLPRHRPQGDLRRQRVPHAAGASAGSTPSRSCGRWPTPC